MWVANQLVRQAIPAIETGGFTVGGVAVVA